MMSIEYCYKCNKLIDTDYDAEHFEECYKCMIPLVCECEECVVKYADSSYKT